MKQIICLIIIQFLVSLSSYAQTTISGKLLNDQQEPISNVSVSYKKVGSLVLAGFTKTDSQGKFELLIKLLDVDSVQLDFNHMAYAKKYVIVANKTANYAYILKQQTREIEEVKLSEIPIHKRKDTVNYNVAAFTSQQDRVIADIIKKLPGIEILGGQILYQGKPLQKYMVNNLDLMEGRYGMINNNLPADAVKKVQIIENDQPIKILDSLVFSDRASLNLELKKFTSTGTGKVGLGVMPVLWEFNITPMTFGKKFQMLNSFQTNNTGHDVAIDLRPFYTGSGFISPGSTIKDAPSYIAIRNVSSPGFDQNKWLDNKIFLFSSNMLQKLNNDLQVKANISYYDDTQRRQGGTITQYYTAEDIILNSEAIDNRYRINIFDAGILLEKNEKKIYLRNYLKYHKRWNSDQGDLLFNGSDQIAQQRTYTDEALLNTLSFSRFIGKQLVTINSKLEWHHAPQRLVVYPGQFTDIFNNGKPYEQITQLVQYRNLNWDSSLGFVKKMDKWSFTPNLELNYRKNDLQTNIELQNLDSKLPLDEGYINDMYSSSLHVGPSIRIGWENKRWKFYLTAPYNLNSYHVDQKESNTLDNSIRNTFNPNTGITYLVDPNNEFSAQLATGQQYGGLENLYNGYIVGEYRSMRRYDTRLLGTQYRNATLSYAYRNTLKANFANVSYGYSQNNRDYIYTTHIDEAGRRSTTIADRNSYNDNHELRAGVSRFFSSLKTVVKLNGTLGWSRSDNLVNNILYKQHVQQRSGTIEVINSLSSILSGEYKTTIGKTKSELAAGRQNKIFYNNHYLNMVAYPHEQHSLKVLNSFYGTNIPGQKHQYFLDATYRYQVKKWKTDIELSVINLLNNNNYIQQFSSNYELVQSYFELRQRQFLITTRFKL